MSSTLVFRVERSEPVLIPPAKPTPYELKNLSDLDDQRGLRMQLPCILLCRNNARMQGIDPVKVIREAIAETLVYYYPLAGRLREGPNDTFILECTGEGVMFIEANANVRLDQFGDVIQPPFPGAEDLLYDVPGTSAMLHTPLLLIQVTRLMCGGFIFGLRMNHTVMDATGVNQFMTAISEMARGMRAPSIQPVWKRELLSERGPPSVLPANQIGNKSHQHRGKTLSHKMVPRSFFLGPQEIATLRNQMPPYLGNCSKSEILTAYLWRCRTMALDLDPDEEVRMVWIVNMRTKFNPPLPKGFYGNAIVVLKAVSTASKLCQNPLWYTVELVKKVKAAEEYERSSLSQLVRKGRPKWTTYLVSDLKNIRFVDADFGWGKAVYGGPTGAMPVEGSFFVSRQNNKGEEGTVVTINLPAPSMEKFVVEIEKLIREHIVTNSYFIPSPL